MNSAAEVQIERDLVRWPRGRWVGVVLGVIAVQGALLLFGPKPLPEVRTKYQQEPTITFAHFSSSSEWLELQDASLFASANPRGFSGLAWMSEPVRNYVAEESLPEASFLSYARFRNEVPARALTAVKMPHERKEPEPTELAVSSVATESASRVRIEGFASRRLVSMPSAPVQYATDAVRPTVVQSLVDADGIVLSARVLESSGSKAIDNSALDLARKARFAPLPADQREAISLGKTIFQWQTLDASGTNAVPAKPAQK